MSHKRPLRVLHACSIVQEKPMLLPVPPVAGCAPCWNVYRLFEAIAAAKPPDLQAEVMSACEPGQRPAVQDFPQTATYHQVVLPDVERHFSVGLKRRVKLASDVMLKTLGTSTWLSYRYMRAVLRHFRRGGFDLLVLDDSPQNLNFLSRYIPPERLIFLLRAQVGLSRRYFDRVGAIIVTNDNLGDYARELLPPGANPDIYIVPNSLGYEFSDADTVAPVDLGEDRPTVVFAGRFVQEKGVRELLHAFTRVLDRVPNARLRIVGGAGYSRDGQEIRTPYVREVRALADALPAGAVSFAGHVPYAQMPAEYRAGDVAVFPSVWVEGFGMTALEAMRCGVPVVVSDRPGFMSFVRDGENGRVIHDPADADGLAAIISDLLTDRATVDRLAAAGQATAQQYTPETTALAYRDALTDFARSVQVKEGGAHNIT
jgi:glycosyltransferase involved in cell wall biosynthesis